MWYLRKLNRQIELGKQTFHHTECFRAVAINRRGLCSSTWGKDPLKKPTDLNRFETLLSVSAESHDRRCNRSPQIRGGSCSSGRDFLVDQFVNWNKYPVIWLSTLSQNHWVTVDLLKQSTDWSCLCQFLAEQSQYTCSVHRSYWKKGQKSLSGNPLVSNHTRINQWDKQSIFL